MKLSTACVLGMTGSILFLHQFDYWNHRNRQLSGTNHDVCASSSCWRLDIDNCFLCRTQAEEQKD